METKRLNYTSDEINKLLNDAEELNNKYQKKNDSSLLTANKNISDAINELKSSIDNIDIPSKTSELTNDSGYITSHQDISHLQPKTEGSLTTSDKTVTGAINELKSSIDNIDIPSKVSELENDIDLITRTEMTNAINNAQLGGSGSDIDLSVYQQITDNSLNTTNKTVPGAINELKSSIDNIDIPDVSIYQTKTDNSLNTTNKTIVGAINELQSTVGSGTGSADVFETDQLTINAVGGIKANVDLNGKTWQEIIEEMFYPYTKPVVNVAGTPNGGTYEKGDNQTITNVKVTITKKSKKITKIEIFDGSTSLANSTTTDIENGGTFNFTVNVAVNSVNKQLTVKVTDETGDANIVSANTGSFTFVYPYYVGVCEENDEITEDLIKGLTKKIEIKANKSISYTTNNQRMIFAYPSSYGNIKTIIDPNAFDVFPSFTLSTMNITGLDNTSQSYNVYINGATTQTNYTMKFNY